MKSYHLFLLAALLVLPSCAQNLQNQIDDQGNSIRRLQYENKTIRTELKRLQEDHETDMNQLHLEMKSLRSATEQKVQQPQADTTSQQGETVESVPPGGEGTQASAPQRPARPAPPSAAATDKDIYNQAYGFYSSGDYEKARKAFGDFTKTHPGSQLVSSAQYWIANSYYKEKKYEEAISACDDVIKKYPQGAKTPDAYYLQALSFVEIKDPTTAQIILEDLIQKFPASEAATVGKQKYEELKGKD